MAWVRTLWVHSSSLIIFTYFLKISWKHVIELLFIFFRKIATLTRKMHVLYIHFVLSAYLLCSLWLESLLLWRHSTLWPNKLNNGHYSLITCSKNCGKFYFIRFFGSSYDKTNIAGYLRLISKIYVPQWKYKICLTFHFITYISDVCSCIMSVIYFCISQCHFTCLLDTNNTHCRIYFSYHMNEWMNEWCFY